MSSKKNLEKIFNDYPALTSFPLTYYQCTENPASIKNYHMKVQGIIYNMTNGEFFIIPVTPHTHGVQHFNGNMIYLLDSQLHPTVMDIRSFISIDHLMSLNKTHSLGTLTKEIKETGIREFPLCNYILLLYNINNVKSHFIYDPRPGNESATRNSTFYISLQEILHLEHITKDVWMTSKLDDAFRQPCINIVSKNKDSLERRLLPFIHSVLVRSDTITVMVREKNKDNEKTVEGLRASLKYKSRRDSTNPFYVENLPGGIFFGTVGPAHEVANAQVQIDPINPWNVWGNPPHQANFNPLNNDPATQAVTGTEGPQGPNGIPQI